MKKEINPQTIAKLQEASQNEKNSLNLRVNTKTALDAINGELSDMTFIDAVPQDLHLLGQSKERDEEIVARFYQDIEKQIDAVETMELALLTCVVLCGRQFSRRMFFFDKHITNYLKQKGYRSYEFLTIDADETSKEPSPVVIFYYPLIMARNIALYKSRRTQPSPFWL